MEFMYLNWLTAFNDLMDLVHLISSIDFKFFACFVMIIYCFFTIDILGFLYFLDTAYF